MPVKLDPRLRRHLGRLKRALLPRRRAQAQRIAASGLWDEAWFLQRYADAPRGGGSNAALDWYVRHGARLRLWSNPLFDADYYLRANPDVAALGLNPLFHYVSGGYVEGRQPNALFDQHWYWEQYPDVAADGMLPLAHYLQCGDAEGRDPHPLFQTAWYREQHAAQLQGGTNALAHYLHEGEAANLRPNPWFDPAFYRAQLTEFPEYGGGLLQHFHEVGAWEDRDPCADFCTQAYRQRHPAVQRRHENPLAHFLRGAGSHDKAELPASGIDAEVRQQLLDNAAALAGDTDPTMAPADVQALHAPLRWYGDDNQTRVQLVTAATQATDAQHTLPLQPTVPLRDELAILILTRDRPEFILPLIDSLADAAPTLQKQAGITLRVLIGDTGSSDEQVRARYAKLPPCCELVDGLDYHFSRCNNLLVARAEGARWVIFLNNDIAFRNAAGSLLRMLHHLDTNPDTGLLGALLCFPDGRVQHEGIGVIDSGALRGFVHHPRAGEKPRLARGSAIACPAATGAALMARAEALYATGGFDENYRAECQDVDLCLTAARAGFATQVINAGRIVHFENGTRPRGEAHWPDRRRLLRKWHYWIEEHWL